jgi:hypothetical protein
MEGWNNSCPAFTGLDAREALDVSPSDKRVLVLVIESGKGERFDVWKLRHQKIISSCARITSSCIDIPGWNSCDKHITFWLAITVLELRFLRCAFRGSVVSTYSALDCLYRHLVLRDGTWAYRIGNDSPASGNLYHQPPR